MRISTRFIIICLWIGLGAGLFFSCQKSTSLSNAAPAATPSSFPVPERQLSTINLPISIPTSVLEQQLNSQLAGVLYQDNDMQDDDLAVKVTKAGPLRIRAEYSKLYLEIPLKVWAKGRWQWNACALCKSIRKTEETEFDLVVRTESRLQVMPNYQLKSYSTGNFSWGDRKPTLSLGPLRINLVPFLESRLKAQLNPLLLQLDQQLQQRVNLPAYLAQAWQQLQQPFALSTAPATWLSIEPKAVRVTPLELQQNVLSLQIGIDAYVGVMTGTKPTLPAQPQLPNFMPVRTLPPEAQIEVSSHVPYGHLTQLLRKEVQHKTFSFEEGKHQLTVHEVKVSGAGDKLLLDLEVSGVAASFLFKKKFQGKVYLTGTPYYDPATQSVKIRDLDFEVETKDQLVNTANWLLHNRFRAQLEEQLTVPVKAQLTSLRQLLESGLAENRLHSNVLLKGSVLSFEPDTLVLTPTGVQVLFLASGKLSLFLD